MQRSLTSLLLLSLLICVTGCGKAENLIKAKGQIVRNGEDLIPDDEEYLQVAFIPINEDRSPARNWYVAEVDQNTGSFYAAGGMKKGMPPGKYRVVVELLKKKKDLFQGKFDGENSPFIVDVDDSSTAPMLLDVEDPPEKTL